MTQLNFSNEKYKQRAINIKTTNNIHTPEDAFLLLINIDKNGNLTALDLENLCKKIQEFYLNSFSNPTILTVEECYKLTQNLNLSDDEKNIILNLAYECIREEKKLGNNTINDGKINTSEWLSHSLYMGEACASLAKMLNLNANTARTYGLLHDFGRKYSHSFDHVTKGFEKLYDIGWHSESIGCLTHSFVNGGRCSNNEPAVEGFYVDENGNPHWENNIQKDDITLFLENYTYNEYDLILNISDLIATSNGIVAPHERIADIATRRKIDPKNRGYFLADLTNLLIDFLNATNTNSYNFKKIKASKKTSLEEIENYFNIVSQDFFNNYINMNEKNREKNAFNI